MGTSAPRRLSKCEDPKDDRRKSWGVTRSFVFFAIGVAEELYFWRSIDI